MPKQNSTVRRRAWTFIRLALLWARKGGVLRGRLLSGHLHVPKFIKTIVTRGDRIGFMSERELSFDKTPAIHVKMHRPSSMRFLIPNIPCINNPPVDFDYDFAGEDEEGPYSAKKSFLVGNGAEEDEEQWSEFTDEDDEVDLKAEEFIAKFYAQMKLQRQISYLEYSDASVKSGSIN